MSGRLQPGQVIELAGGVRRLVAPNPGLMTGPGTNTYILGECEKAVLDPGPAIDAHVAAILDAAAGALRWILVTHTHTDHSPAAALLAAQTGAELVGRPAPRGEHQDPSFRPARAPADGEVLAAPDFTLEVLETPGHASNHLCYRHRELKWLFTGDHIINGSTVVIDPPDGNMRDYIGSLRHLRHLELTAIAPGHGELITEPYSAIEALIEHRLAREEKVLAAVRQHPGCTPAELVPPVYVDVDPSLFRLAERSLIAHLEKLEAEARVRRRDGGWRAL
jgi:glyoxylase-like metal-dependent hydrolase (beta-lactamase superfamily II)